MHGAVDGAKSALGIRVSDYPVVVIVVRVVAHRAQAVPSLAAAVCVKNAAAVMLQPFAAMDAYTDDTGLHAAENAVFAAQGLDTTHAGAWLFSCLLALFVDPAVRIHGL